MYISFSAKKKHSRVVIGVASIYIYIHMIPVPGPVAPPNGMVPYFLT